MKHLAILAGTWSTVEKSPAKYRVRPCDTMLLLQPKIVGGLVLKHQDSGV